MISCPHCLGSGCIHCREAAAQRSTQQRKSRLNDTERKAFGLVCGRLWSPKPERLRRQGDHRRHQAPPLANTVLPAGFVLLT